MLSDLESIIKTNEKFKELVPFLRSNSFKKQILANIELFPEDLHEKMLNLIIKLKPLLKDIQNPVPQLVGSKSKKSVGGLMSFLDVREAFDVVYELVYNEVNNLADAFFIKNILGQQVGDELEGLNAFKHNAPKLRRVLEFIKELEKNKKRVYHLDLLLGERVKNSTAGKALALYQDDDELFEEALSFVKQLRELSEEDYTLMVAGTLLGSESRSGSKSNLWAFKDSKHFGDVRDSIIILKKEHVTDLVLDLYMKHLESWKGIKGFEHILDMFKSFKAGENIFFYFGLINRLIKSDDPERLKKNTKLFTKIDSVRIRRKLIESAYFKRFDLVCKMVDDYPEILDNPKSIPVLAIADSLVSIAKFVNDLQKSVKKHRNYILRTFARNVLEVKKVTDEQIIEVLKSTAVVAVMRGGEPYTEAFLRCEDEFSPYIKGFLKMYVISQAGKATGYTLPQIKRYLRRERVKYVLLLDATFSESVKVLMLDELAKETDTKVSLVARVKSSGGKMSGLTEREQNALKSGLLIDVPWFGNRWHEDRSYARFLDDKNYYMGMPIMEIEYRSEDIDEQLEKDIEVVKRKLQDAKPEEMKKYLTTINALQSVAFKKKQELYYPFEKTVWLSLFGEDYLDSKGKVDFAKVVRVLIRKLGRKHAKAKATR